MLLKMLGTKDLKISENGNCLGEKMVRVRTCFLFLGGRPVPTCEGPFTVCVCLELMHSQPTETNLEANENQRS